MTLHVRGDEDAQEVHVRFGDRGLVYVLDSGGAVRTQFQDSTAPMVDEDEAVDRVLDLITDVPLSAVVRKRLAEALGVDPDGVGRKPVKGT